jgi:hypothetical protein
VTWVFLVGSLAGLVLARQLYVGEECAVDGDVLDCAGRGVDAEVVGFEEVAEPVAVDEGLPWRRGSPGRRWG